MSCNLGAQLPQPLALPLGAEGLEPAASDTSLEAGLVEYLKAHALVGCLIGNEDVYPYFVPRHIEEAERPCIVYKMSGATIPGITGQSGIATVSLDLECWSLTLDTSAKLANAARAACQAFKGYWGLCPIIGSWYQTFDDDAEKPGDNSATYWFCRTVTFNVAHYVPVHTF